MNNKLLCAAFLTRSGLYYRGNVNVNRHSEKFRKVANHTISDILRIIFSSTWCDLENISVLPKLYLEVIKVSSSLKTWIQPT